MAQRKFNSVDKAYDFAAEKRTKGMNAHVSGIGKPYTVTYTKRLRTAQRIGNQFRRG